MTDEQKNNFVSIHEKSEDNLAKMNEYCELDEDQRDAFIDEHRDEYKSQMKDKMSEYKKEHKMQVNEMKKHKDVRDHKKYSQYCEMSGEDRAREIDDLEKLEKISEWCEMIPEERDDFKKEHHDVTMDFKEKHHGDLTDKKKSELKMKFKDHMSSTKVKMAHECKSAIYERLAEMKVFKAELRERSSDMTDEEKQELRTQFIENAKDMQLAWISPRVQMNAGLMQQKFKFVDVPVLQSPTKIGSL
ncbi:MAG: hypothetical protein ACRBB5_03530 [Nitrosopumilus sp.]